MGTTRVGDERQVPIPCRFPGNYQRAQHRGHGSVAFTLDTYSQVLPHMQDAAKQKVRALLINAAAAQAPRRSEAEGTQKCQSMRRWWFISGQGQPGSRPGVQVRGGSPTR